MDTKNKIKVMKIKSLNENHPSLSVLEKLQSFLNDNDLEIIKPINSSNGLVIRHKENYFSFYQEGDISETLPPLFEGAWVIVEDETGNLKEF